MGEHVEELWASFKRGEMFSKESCHKMLLPCCPKSTWDLEAMVNRTFFFFPLSAEEETEVKGDRVDVLSTRRVPGSLHC